MKFLIAVLAAMFITFSAHAAPAKKKASVVSQKSTQAQGLSTLSDTWKKLKESPYKLNFNQYNLFPAEPSGQVMRSDVVYNDLALGYNINTFDSVRILTRGVTVLSTRKEAEQQWRHIEGRYKRNKILTEDKHYINFSAEFRAAYIPDEKRRKSQVSHGFIRPQINASKTFTKTISVDFSAFSIINDNMSGDRKGNQKLVREDDYVLTPSYVLNDKVTLSVGFTFFNDVYLDNGKNRDVPTEFVVENHLEIDPAVNYVFTNWLNMDFDIGTTTNKSHDASKLWIKNIQSEYWVGIAFNVTGF